MLVAGCDVGSLTAKAVILCDGTVSASHVMRDDASPEASARKVFQAVLSQAGLSEDAIQYCVGTGYGRKRIPFVNEVLSEIACHAMAVKWLLPCARTILDVGGQDAKAIRLDDQGNVVRYVYNDKCASGTGRFLEIMSTAMEVDLEDLGRKSLESSCPIKISNQCTVFAETEVISQMNSGANLSDIINGLHRAMANRVASLARSIEIEEAVVMSGGVAKNVGMYRALEDALDIQLSQVPSDPQINGALGAALFAQERMSQRAVV